jgi:ubiquinone/menaquinone biosynthesis C-methylase UbiE
MSLRLFRQTALSRALLLKLAAPRAHDTINHFARYLQPGESILDVGAGIGDITALLRKRGHPITALDVRDLSLLPDIKPIIYDGQTMPFANKQFDTALVLTVLHHTPRPEQVLDEAIRVAKRVIITEDIFYTSLHKYATFFMDSLLNLEFFGHPHSNKTDAQWRTLFKKKGLKLVGEKSMGSFGVLRHRMYILETPGA